MAVPAPDGAPACAYCLAFLGSARVHLDLAAGRVSGAGILIEQGGDDTYRALDSAVGVGGDRGTGFFFETAGERKVEERVSEDPGVQNAVDQLTAKRAQLTSQAEREAPKGTKQAPPLVLAQVEAFAALPTQWKGKRYRRREEPLNPAAREQANRGANPRPGKRRAGESERACRIFERSSGEAAVKRWW